MTKSIKSNKVANGATKGRTSPFEQIRRTSDTGNEYWSSRDFARILDYSDYRNFEQVINKARTACMNSGQSVDDHIVDVTEMIEVGKGAKREIKTAFLSRYACYLIVRRGWRQGAANHQRTGRHHA
jgi:DNA-damage-inducible protein D